MKKHNKLSLWVLFINLLVIIWGAFVRASGSGAGCGAHWPLCNGAVIPQSPEIETLIEFIHRLMSGVAFLAVFLLLWKTIQTYKKGHRARKAAWGAFILIVLESLIGAALVLFQLTGDNSSIMRAIVIAIHLVNTMLLIAALTLTHLYGLKPDKENHWVKKSIYLTLSWIIGSILLLFIGVTGAITALGDTLFPAESLIQGIQTDFQSSAHFLIQLRIIHPIIAVTSAFVIFLVVNWMLREYPAGSNERKLGYVLRGAIGGQLLLGIINVILLAPIWMQLIHLLVSNLVWISWVSLIGLFTQPSQSSLGVSDEHIHDRISPQTQ